ncbi:flagellar biosynthesis protein FlhF [Paenibacillus doosanensis]|uniref:Flagellar biosynthesis protein FlhF n=1 Tax=Paenibacillus konkukensis TaxID=2020716 RepID=A0ABY4RZJ7_9BACL|nr:MULTISPECIES: flagellar biosynthesis protein FlhF [Paenibacillus]MCS7461878.1 flagellar biosynthesis protein FlhF [Paenibacillus doosanensis]UQZ87353.1 Flagellar biosynthesis protein FlhF [Paenibacillus konkukensis]
MRVKRYVVDSMPDALQKIRTDLGKDAVILNTKEIRSGGFLGMFAKKKIEVIAATDAGAASSAGGFSEPKLASAKPAAAKAAMIYPDAAAAYSRPVKAVPSVPAAKPGHAAADQAAVLSFPEVPDVLVPSSAQPAPAPVPRAAAAVRSQEPASDAASGNRGQDDLLLQEMKQMKEYMYKLSVQGSGQAQLDPALEQIQQRLLQQEVDPELVQRIVAAASEEAAADEAGITELGVRRSVKRQLLELFPDKGGKPLSPGTQIAHFVGPTGVGKTTTIAKLAAEQVLKYQRKVGFITSDTYRIAAVEQLKTYATILNVPLEVVFSPQDLPKAFEQLKDCDIIFMDTAGRNFRNEMYVSELNSLLQSGGRSETYLVLSMTTKYKDMKAITDNFSKFKLDKVLFTKLDETDSFGGVINLVHDFQLQLSYVTNGQSVPDDIFTWEERQIVDLILGDDGNE